MSKKHRRNGFAFAIALGLISVGCEDLAIKDVNSLLFPGLHRSEVWGFAAGFGTTFAAVPDMIAMFRRHSSTGMNPTMAGILAVFQLVWIYYGLLIGSRPVIAWNLLAFLINSLGVVAYAYFSHRERKVRTSIDS